MSWLSPPSIEVIPKCLVHWCEISNLHKFNLEFQKYHKAGRDTILKSDLQHFGQWVFIYSHFCKKNGLSENMILGIFFRGGQNLLLCKFLLLCYCFQTKFQGVAKVFRGANSLRGAPAPLWKKARIFDWMLFLELTFKDNSDH